MRRIQIHIVCIEGALSTHMVHRTGWTGEGWTVYRLWEVGGDPKLQGTVPKKRGIRPSYSPYPLNHMVHRSMREGEVTQRVAMFGKREAYVGCVGRLRGAIWSRLWTGWTYGPPRQHRPCRGEDTGATCPGCVCT